LKIDEKSSPWHGKSMKTFVLGMENHRKTKPLALKINK